MNHELVSINEYRVTIDYSVEENLKSFKEEVLNHLYDVHKDVGVDNLLFSGGMDSTFILRSLLELGIAPRLHTLSFSKDLTDYDSLLAISQCKKFGVKKPKFFYLERQDVIKHINTLAFDRGIALGHLHSYYVDFFLSSMGNKKFFCGMACEYRITEGLVKINPAPAILKFYNPDRLYGFDSSRTLLAFINNQIFKENYLIKNDIINVYGENVWRVRDLIYNDCYPEIDILTKTPPCDRYIADIYYECIRPYLRRILPHNTLLEPFYFDAREYLESKLP